MSSCIAYTILKPTIMKHGMYTPFPTLDKPWESISMEYISSLPLARQGNDCVFVVVDRFSKMSILIVYKKNITTEAISELFSKRVWIHFGIPQTVILDQDNRFLSTFWLSLWSFLDTKHTNPLPSTPKLMVRKRSPIIWSCIYCICTTPSTHTHGMKFSHMFNTYSTKPSVARPTTTIFRWA